MFVVFDTETTGHALFGRPAAFEGQPKIVSIAALLCDDDGKEVSCMSTLIHPAGWEIPLVASEIHGITTEEALAKGIKLDIAMEFFAEFVEIADTLVAHNLMFDQLVVNHATSLLNPSVNLFHGKILHCTKNAATNILKIKKPTGGYKWPKLTEAYRHFFNEDFEGAHGALADTRACKAVYMELKKLGVFNET